VPQRYSFVRRYADEEPDNGFDHDQRLLTFLALSRLVQPTSVGLELSAQVWGQLDAAELIEHVLPGPVTGPASEAWVADVDARDWLTEADAAALRELFAVYRRGPLPDRVARALWFHEFAARTFDGAVRWTLVATGLEALTNTDKVGVFRQFVRRCESIATECGVPWDRRQIERAYDLRSKVSHGAVSGLTRAWRSLPRAISRRSVAVETRARCAACSSVIQSVVKCADVPAVVIMQAVWGPWPRKSWTQTRVVVSNRRRCGYRVLK
jgi:hypothetical protein